MGATIGTDLIDLFKNDWFLLGDMADFICGDWVGSGCSRAVYSFNLDKRFVVKIDRNNGFDNQMEWEIWNNVNHHNKALANFLAPCVKISGCGRLLLQERTTPILSTKELPEKVPSFIADLKLQNWGKLGDRIVCHDYANHAFMNCKNIEMVTVENWRDHNNETPDK